MGYVPRELLYFGDSKSEQQPTNISEATAEGSSDLKIPADKKTPASPADTSSSSEAIPKDPGCLTVSMHGVVEEQSAVSFHYLPPKKAPRFDPPKIVKVVPVNAAKEHHERFKACYVRYSAIDGFSRKVPVEGEPGVRKTVP